MIKKVLSLDGKLTVKRLTRQEGCLVLQTEWRRLVGRCPKCGRTTRKVQERSGSRRILEEIRAGGEKVYFEFPRVGADGQRMGSEDKVKNLKLSKHVYLGNNICASKLLLTLPPSMSSAVPRQSGMPPWHGQGEGPAFHRGSPPSHVQTTALPQDNELGAGFSFATAHLQEVSTFGQPPGAQSLYVFPRVVLSCVRDNPTPRLVIHRQSHVAS